MFSIAKGMQKALRKALGIKSPARALIPDGVNTTRGIAVGVVQGLPHIDSAMRMVSGRVTPGARVPAVATMPAGRGAASAQGATVIHQHSYYLVNQGAIGSQHELQDWFTRMLDNTGRTNRIPPSLVTALRRAA